VVVLKDGTTLSDAGAFLAAAAASLMEAAEQGGSIEGATAQLQLALFLEARYLRPCPSGTR
jgi:hypothetical protein